MRIIFFGNNWVGLQVLQFLLDRLQPPDELIAVVLHPPERSAYRCEMLDALRGRPLPILEGNRIHSTDLINDLQRLQPDLGIATNFGYILPQAILDLAPRGIVNLHASLLPWNRGAYPNVWPIIDGTSAGVSLHYMDAGIDTGDLICQREVPIYPTDTGESLYRRLELAAMSLFRETWPALLRGDAPRSKQPVGGSVHRVRDVEPLDRIDLDQSYTGRQLIDLLRARTFPPHRGAYFEVNGERIYIRVSLESDKGLPDTPSSPPAPPPDADSSPLP